MVLFYIIAMGFIGAIIGGAIKIFQWVAADLTFGILIKMPTLDSVLPMILKAAVIGMVFGLILGIYNLLPSNDCSYQEHHKEHDNRLHDYEYHAKKERYINASDAWCKSGDDYIDASGAWRKPGDDYIDASGAWRKSGDDYIDASGAWRKSGDDYIDASGAWRKPGDDYIDASGAWRKPGDK